jgi:hypothetical protein
MFNFNVRIEDEVVEEENMYHILGKSERTLPALDRRLQYGRNGKPRFFYYPKSNSPFESDDEEEQQDYGEENGYSS